MENEIYVVSLFDGDKGVMMAGTRSDDGRVVPLAVERRNGLAAGSVVNGVITVNDETRKMVNDLTQFVTNRLAKKFDRNVTINGTYLCAMPRSMRSVMTVSDLTLDTRRRITDGDINELCRNAKADASAYGDLMATYNSGFIKDGAEMRNVVGESAKNLKMKNLSVIVNKHFVTDYKGLMPKSMDMKGVMPASVAVGGVVTTSDERDNGVLSIHFCADTTLFTAYYDDMIIATCVVPFGEQDLIHDLCSTYFHDPKVWRKIYDGWDFVNGVKVKIKDSTTGSTRSMDDSDVMCMHNAACMRLKEIISIGIDWMRDQAEGEDFEKVVSKVVFSGALTSKPGFIDSASNKLMPESDCRLGDASMVIDNTDYLDDNDYIPLIGMLQMASSNCVEIQKPVEQPEDETAPEQPQPEQPKQQKKRFSFLHKATEGVHKATQGVLDFGDDDSL